MARWTITLLKRVSPEKRLTAAAWTFWVSVFGGVFSTAVIAHGFYERVLMGISWGAISLTAIDRGVTHHHAPPVRR